MFLIAVVTIALISVGLAILSLRKELRRTEHKRAKEVQQSLAKGRVIFYSPSSSKS